jgi:uroporphyrinogen-III decarboxylase
LAQLKDNYFGGKQMITSQDRNIIRELAKLYVEKAAEPVNAERKQRIIDMHSLQQVRPPVWIDELPWHEMNFDGKLDCYCEDKEARDIELHFRKKLMQWEYFQVDTVLEDAWYVNKSFSETGIGLNVNEETLKPDSANNISSHHYEDQLPDEKSLEKMVNPIVTAYPEVDAKNLERMNDLFDGIMPVKLRGTIIGFSPWDDIPTFHGGVENCYIDMAERPDFVHKMMRKFTDTYISRIEQWLELGLFDWNIENLHCTPPYCAEVPGLDFKEGDTVQLKNIWMRCKAQLMTSVSPDMQDEFDLQYMKPVMEQCAVTYYGCCEVLDRFVPYLRKIKTMRKMGCSPWANPRKMAEQMGSDFVLARKPNPAFVAIDFNPDIVKKEITETIKACLDNKTPYEFVLKDISTVSYKPQNIICWANTVEEAIDAYYR